MKLKIDLNDFNKKMYGVTNYTDGFISVLMSGESKIAESIAESAVDSAYTYIDAMARVHPDQLHHVYEWQNSGNPNMRLYKFSINSINKNNYQIKSQFLDSRMPASVSGQIFIKKALVMEIGQPLTVAPKRSKVLSFEIDGETIFTPNEVHIANPGGNVSGEFANVVRDFQQYFESTFSRSIIGTKIRKIGKFFRPGQNPNKSSGQRAAIRFISGLNEL